MSRGFGVSDKKGNNEATKSLFCFVFSIIKLKGDMDKLLSPFKKDDHNKT